MKNLDLSPSHCRVPSGPIRSPSNQSVIWDQSGKPVSPPRRKPMFIQTDVTLTWLRFLIVIFFFWIPGFVFISDCVLQALMHYAGSRNSMDHGLPLLEVYCLSINCFAAARSHLTAESDRVALVLKRLALWVLTNNPKKNIQSVYSLLNHSHQPFTWARSSVKENTVCSQFICLSLLLQAHELYSIVAHTQMRKHETIK